jgi:hypothetical protein
VTVSNTIIIIPDFLGAGLRNSAFMNLVRAYAPEGAIIVPVLNGASEEELTAMTLRSPGFVDPIVDSCSHNLVEVLLASYRYALAVDPESIVVRMDHSEHPSQHIPQLLETACRIGGMVVGDLEFPDGILTKGSVDEFAHLSLFPELFSMVTSGRLRLSCAHGYQVFGPGVLRRVFYKAEMVIAEAKNRFGEQRWGMDTAMVLAAMGSNVPVVVQTVPADIPRNRPNEKVLNQVLSVMRICSVASDLFDY